MDIFFVGMPVICIDDKNPPKQFPWYLPNKPICGCAYTVREVLINRSGEIGILVRELVNPTCRISASYIFEPAFHAWRFRPAAEVPSLKRRREPPEFRHVKELTD